MIWLLSNHIPSLLSCPPDILRFANAGEPNEQVIQNFLAANHHPPTRKQRDVTLPRYYYLYEPDRRIRLCTIGSTLTGWSGGAYILVGRNEILGEFGNDDPGSPYIGNRDLAGQKGLQLTMRPISRFKGFADKEFDNFEEMLAEIEKGKS